MTLPSWASPDTACFKNSFCSLLASPAFSESLPKARPKAASTFRAWSMSNRSTRADVLPFDQPDFQIAQESADGQPKIVPDHHDALHLAPIALPQGLHQFGMLFVFLRMQPLLELVEDDQHLLARWNALTTAQRRQRLFQAQPVGQGRTAFPQAVQQPGFCLLGGGLHVNGDHCTGQAGQQSRLNQRRLAAAGWPVNEAHRERVVSIRLLDPGLPEADTVGQTISIPWPRQQFEEEVGIVGVEGPQSFRHDLDWLADRSRRRVAGSRV